MSRIDLLKRKEKLFRRKEVSEWSCPPEKLSEAIESLHDAELAFNYMLPNATQQVNYLEEESNYFSTQTWKESRRTVMMDYALAREVFVDVGEQIQRHIFELNNGWGQFLDFYTDLNNARKESDDTFVEKNYIGEEIAEPEETKTFNEDLFDHYENDGVFNDDNISEGSSGLLRGRSDSISTPRKGDMNILTELKKQINQEENEGKEVSSFDPIGSEVKAKDQSRDIKNQMIEEEI